jgi:hypothetical protein
MKTALLYVHLLSLAVAIGSMLIAEHLISQRLMFSRERKFTSDSYDIVLFTSRAVTVSLLLLWLTGIGFVVLGYLNDPAYIENQKIWAKVSIVILVSINGMYIHRSLLPRLADVSAGGLLIRNAWESARLRLSFSASIAGWLIATFYGAAKFLNQGYHYSELFGLYLIVVAMMFAFSYLASDQLINGQQPDGAVA